MRTLLNVIGVLLVVTGGIWILQGVGIMPGSFMTGQTKWAVYGVLTVIAGIAVQAWGRRNARNRRR